MALQRLQKIIAQAGVCSRRGAEDLIVARRVSVNGRIVAELGAKADARRDRIEVDGKLLTSADLVYVVLHKPRGCVTTVSDPQGRPTVVELVRDVPARLFPVGRLDFATSGVLLLTNDGDFAQALMHPKKKVPKTYVMKLDGRVDDKEIERWRKGIDLEDGPTLPADVRLLRHEAGKAWLEITLREGRNQQLRRMAEARGFFAMRLARLSFAGVTSEGLRPGQWREVTVDEQRKLRREYGVPKRVRTQRALGGDKDRRKGRSSKRGAAGPKAGRSDRSEKTPRATGRRASRGPGRGRR